MIFSINAFAHVVQQGRRQELLIIRQFISRQIEDLQTVVARLEGWANANGYEKGDTSRWTLNSVPQRQTLANLERLHFWKPNVFDRWQMTPTGLRRASPDLSFQIISSAKSKETIVNYLAHTGGEDRLFDWEEIEGGLIAAFYGGK